MIIIVLDCLDKPLLLYRNGFNNPYIEKLVDHFDLRVGHMDGMFGEVMRFLISENEKPFLFYGNDFGVNCTIIDDLERLDKIGLDYTLIVIPARPEKGVSMGGIICKRLSQEILGRSKNINTVVGEEVTQEEFYDLLMERVFANKEEPQEIYTQKLILEKTKGGKI